MKKSSLNIFIQCSLVFILFLLINMIGQKWYSYIDLTEDKRFTLEESTEKIIGEIENVIFIDVLLEGDLNSSFIRLQERTNEILNQFKNINPNVEYKFTNPSQGSAQEINMMRENLRKDGIFPSTLFIVENDQRVEKLIYPFAIINYGDRRIPVNLLEPIGQGESEEEAINRSAILLEYKIASAISKLIQKKAPIIMFLEGNGELTDDQTAMLETLLRKTMVTGRLNLDSTYQISKDVDLLIVARPQQSISLRNQFIIDQYIMNGGKVIWLIDQFYVNLDSINLNKTYIPKPLEHELDDLFFKYGIRINRNLILDLENTKIPQVFGMSGDKAQQQLFPWVFHPLLQANIDNPIVKNIDRVASTFPSSIEVLSDDENPKSSTLLTSSQYSRYQVYPSINISFEIIRLEQRPEAYNKPRLPVAVLMEGKFESFFKNRVSQDMLRGLEQINASFQESSESTKQLFIADGDLIKNLYDPNTNRISPIGFNKWEGYTYKGNEDFIINAIDYMLDDYGLVAARSKNYQIRMLDQVRLRKETIKWQIINLLIPSLLVLLIGIIYSYIRKKKFA